MSGERFISEALAPDLASEPALPPIAGEPVLPSRFTWREQTYTVAEVLRRWRDTSPCSHGSPEQYVRKHWYEVRMTGGERMKIYFERQARSKKETKKRWWLYTLQEPGDMQGT